MRLRDAAEGSQAGQSLLGRADNIRQTEQQANNFREKMTEFRARANLTGGQCIMPVSPLA
jgi:hypothetical protein